MSTPAVPAALTLLRTQYQAQIDALIARHSIQAQNVAHYAQQIATATLGKVRLPIATKGSPTIPVGTLVLLWRAAPLFNVPPSATIWAPEASCPIQCHGYHVADVSSYVFVYGARRQHETTILETSPASAMMEANKLALGAGFYSWTDVPNTNRFVAAYGAWD